MKKLTTIFFILSIIIQPSLSAQDLSLDYETLSKSDCNNETISFSRQLVPLKSDEAAFSTIDERYLLFAHSNKEIYHQFYEIGGYASGFLNKKSLIHTDATGDESKDLIVKINAHESMPFISFYTIDSCNFKYNGTVFGYDYSILDDGKIIVENYAACDGWDECISEVAPKMTEISLVFRHDYYKIIDNEIQRIHPPEAESTYEFLIQFYKKYYSQLEDAVTSGEWKSFEWHLKSTKEKVRALINEYQGYLKYF